MSAPRRRPIVLVDANALLLPFTVHFRLEQEIYGQVDGARVAVPSSVLGELDRIASRGNVNARAAREYARRFEEVPTDHQGDDALVQLGRQLHAWVLTGDRALRKRLLKAGVPVLFPRGKTHLDRAVSPPRPARVGRKNSHRPSKG